MVFVKKFWQLLFGKKNQLCKSTIFSTHGDKSRTFQQLSMTLTQHNFDTDIRHCDQMSGKFLKFLIGKTLNDEQSLKFLTPTRLK